MGFLYTTLFFFPRAFASLEIRMDTEAFLEHSGHITECFPFPLSHSKGSKTDLIVPGHWNSFQTTLFASQFFLLVLPHSTTHTHTHTHTQWMTDCRSDDHSNDPLEVPFVSGTNGCDSPFYVPTQLLFHDSIPEYPAYIVSSRSIYKSSQSLPAVKFVYFNHLYSQGVWPSCISL